MQLNESTTNASLSKVMTYYDWNDKLAYRFFNREVVGRPVYLYVTDELIERVGAPFGGTVANFVQTVKAGPAGTTRDGLCQKAHQSFQDWRQRNPRYYPPYIAFLGLFVLAAGLDGTFAPTAYYPRLWTLLGEPGRKGMVPSFNHMLDLWDDLERWSDKDKRGELGVFKVQIAGNWIHVGLPVAQTILTEHERNELPVVFANAHLDPTSQPSDVELARLLRRYGSDHLRRRTIDLFMTPKKDEAELRMYETLSEIVKEELAAWDGTVEIGDTESSAPQSQAYASLRLCASLDRVSGRIKMGFRCRANRDLPEGDLLLKDNSSGALYCGEENIPRWSSILANCDTGAQVDASQYDWNQVLEFNEERFGWRFRLPSSPIRILTSGESEGLPGLIEVQQLFPSTPFYLVVSAAHASQVLEWGQTCCEEFKELQISEGLRFGWRLFSSRGAISDEGIRDAYPILAFSRILSLSVHGGLRSSHGNTFFDFGLPQIVLIGGNGTEKAYANDVELKQDSESRVYSLPAGLRSGAEVIVEVKRETKDGLVGVRRRTLYIENDFDWTWSDSAYVFDSFGKYEGTEKNENGVSGAYGRYESPDSYEFVLPWQVFQTAEVLFIGAAPGQIASWRNEGFPNDWSPVWAIPFERERGRAIYCGSSLQGPIPTRATHNRKKLNQWQEVLWHWRRRIEPPSQPILSRLWRQFQEAARHAR